MKVPFKLKSQKIKCECGCPITLYVDDFGDGQIAIAVEPNARKNPKNVDGMIISRDKLFEVLNTEGK